VAVTGAATLPVAGPRHVEAIVTSIILESVIAQPGYPEMADLR